MKTIQKSYAAFEAVFNTWQNALTNYKEADLSKRLSEDSWTLGQVYVHLINSTLNFHIKQVNLCLNSSDNKDSKKNFKGILAFNILNGFPPIKIKVPPTETYTPKHPANKQELLDGFERVKLGMNECQTKFNSNQQGKTAHPAFAFLNAVEWFRIVDMHWRHHLRQKSELDAI
ncbi:MAG: hypothetical protein CFE21_03300 [Bacteroidetes bacterium B1(2017)]|nr:MAG: hypothetical protein CFE21_03300 [Bacteroidetes bacterium B1(2017)]